MDPLKSADEIKGFDGDGGTDGYGDLHDVDGGYGITHEFRTDSGTPVPPPPPSLSPDTRTNVSTGAANRVFRTDSGTAVPPAPPLPLPPPVAAPPQAYEKFETAPDLAKIHAYDNFSVDSTVDVAGAYDDFRDLDDGSDGYDPMHMHPYSNLPRKATRGSAENVYFSAFAPRESFIFYFFNLVSSLVSSATFPLLLFFFLLLDVTSQRCVV